MSNFDTLRRIADRGLSSARREWNGEQIDLWQHMKDEIERARANRHNNLLYSDLHKENKNFDRGADDVDEDEDIRDMVEIDLEDHVLLKLAMQAHRKDVTLNQHIIDCIQDGIDNPLTDENGDDIGD